MKKTILLLAALVSPLAYSDSPTKVQLMCHEQAVLIDQTYQFFRQGDTESEAYEKQVAQSASPQTKAWMKRMVHRIFSDSRSLIVNVDATIFQYEGECNRAPEKFARDQSILR